MIILACRVVYMLLGRLEDGSWAQFPAKKMVVSVRLLLLTIIAASLAAGCTAKVRLSPKAVAPETVIGGSATVVVAPAALGVPETIGHETISLFAIPAIAVKLSNPEPGIDLMNGVREALRQAGYVPVPLEQGQGKPVLECRVHEVYFKNYTYFLPVVRTWGRVRLELSLVENNGAVRWQRHYAEDFAETSVDVDDFQSALNLTVGKILTRAAADFTQPDFKQACCGDGSN